MIRAISLVGTGALMLCLAACGGGSSASTSSSSTSSTTSSSSSTTSSTSGGTGTSTASVDCPYSETGNTISLTSTTTGASSASWTCTSSLRSLTGNGIPNHAIGTFPNANNPNSPTAQSVSFSASISPATASANTTGSESALAYALNSVKFDPATAGSCPSTATSAADCTAIGTGTWTLEALGQTFFSFGTDSNNAHVQPNGAYHYHGVPEGLLTVLGVSSSSPKMVLVGWAPDGFPIYARYGYSVATNASSAIKVITSSYSLKTTPDSGRPSTTDIPLGAFTQDYQYVAGSGDLDDCNGRTGVTPEFPNGIYHYYITDTFPFAPRCWKGTIN